VRSAVHTRERAVAGLNRGLLALGDEVTWQATHFGLELRLSAKIVEFDRPRSFVDVMTAGPFHSMRHEHGFVPDENGTLMLDTFVYEAPLGPIGRAIARFVLTNYLRGFLRRRADVLKTMAEL